MSNVKKSTSRQVNKTKDVTPPEQKEHISRAMANTRKMPSQKDKEFWAMLKEAFAEKPVEVNGQFNARTEYYRKKLLTIIKGRVKVKCPDWWDIDFMLDNLLLNGYFIIANSKVGVAPFKGNVHGVNMFLRPPKGTIVNEVLGTWDVKFFGKNANAVLIYLFDDRWMRGFDETIRIYAEKLASCDCSIDVNLINTRVPYIFNCMDTKQANEAKLIYDQISLGKPAVFTKVKDPMDSKSGGVDILTLPVKDNFIADSVVELKRSIIGEFLTEIGLNSNSYEKKERLITAEVDSNNDERDYSIKYINKNLKRQSKKVNKMFGDKLERSFKIKIKVGGQNGSEEKKNGKDLYQKADQKRYASGTNK